MERPGHPPGDGRRDDHDGEDADQPRDREGHVEQWQEPAVAGLRGHVRLQGGDGPAVADDGDLVMGGIAGRRPSERSERRAVEPDHPDLPAERRRDPGHDRLGADEPGRSRQPVGQGHCRVVEALLLLGGQDRLETATHHAIDDDADQQEHPEDRHAEEQPESPGERASAGRVRG